MMCVLLIAMSDESVYLSPAPLYHGAPLRFTMANHIIGSTAVIMERFDAEQFLAAIERYSVTHTQVVPTMFVRMLKLPDEQRLRYDFSSLTSVLHAAAPCPVEAKHRMIEWLGTDHQRVRTRAPRGTGPPSATASSGWPIPARWGCPSPARSTSLTRPPAPRCPSVMRALSTSVRATTFEYHLDEEKTRDSRLPNGWSTIGDVGRVDDDGFLYLTDRKSYMIISGGVNVYPQEAENHLTMHPAVLDVAVIGVPDDDLGEVPKAVVQPMETPDGHEAAAALERELIDYCRASLASVKCPRTVDFRSELPRDETGKLYKRLLRDEYWQSQDRRI